MGFCQGNNLWTNRQQHGRAGRFATADALLKAAQDYFEFADSNPWLKVEPKLRHVDGAEDACCLVNLPVARPYTVKGMCLYWNAGETYWRQLKRAKKDDTQFQEVISRIESIIYVQKFEGAAVGVFNANIIARDLNMRTSEHTINGGAVLVRRDQPNGGIVVQSIA